MGKKDTILVADNSKVNREILGGIFAGQYRCAEAGDGAQAIRIIELIRDSLAAVIMDFSLPGRDGYAVISGMRTLGLTARVPVIAIVPDTSPDSETRVIDAGATDVITPPFDAQIVRRRVMNASELFRRRQFRAAVAEEESRGPLSQSAGVSFLLSSVIDAANFDAGNHARRLTMYVRLLLERIAEKHPEALPDGLHIDSVASAASLHDIGMAAIPDAILAKPGALTDAEYEVVKTHTKSGWEALGSLADMAGSEYLQYARDICRFHHERFDGSGYPEGLSGDAIPIFAQSVGIADCFDALTRDRAYKNAVPPVEAIAMIFRGECGAFSPLVFDALGDLRVQFAAIAEAYRDSPPSYDAGMRGLTDGNALPEIYDHRRFGDDGVPQDMIVGVQKCRNDEWLTMPEAADGLLRLLGYTRCEIEDDFRSRYIELVYPADRGLVLQAGAGLRRGGQCKETEYRLVSKSGGVFWILEKSQLLTDAAGDEYFCRVLIDVTRSKNAEDELRSLIERYQSIIDQTNDLIFEWRADEDQLSFSPSWHRRFGYYGCEIHVIGGRSYARYLHKDDLGIFENMLSVLRASSSYTECEARVADSAGVYRWCKFRVTALHGQDGAINRAVGIITDIDAEKKTLLRLRNMAERDSLTLLYNKKVAKNKIEKYIASMQPGDAGAMFVIDVDDFKRINDHYGHMLGDAVLQKIAAELESVFRSDDIVARIGGDEFLVFMVSVRNVRIIEERASRINGILQGVIIQTIPDHTISCSMGIVLCPSGGSTFDELFIHGDVALYDAKRRGKNQHSFYKPDMGVAEFEVSAGEIITDAEPQPQKF